MRGLKPLPYDYRDYDLHKTLGATAAPAFPDDLNVDAGLWTPDQNVGGDAFNLPPMPNGCTDYAQTDLCIDEDRALLDPMLLEQVTHANALGGIDMRTSLSAALKVFSRTAYFRITAVAPLDFFDAIRLAMLSTEDEHRAVSVGTPWFLEWGNPLRGGILPLPASFSTLGLGWHNWKVAGWKTIGGAPYLICKMWCGESYGDEGFVYMSRELCNAVLNISGTAAYTMTKVTASTVQTIDFDFVKFCVSFIRDLFSFTAPPGIPEVPATVPVTAQNAPQQTQDASPTIPPAPTPSEAPSAKYDWSNHDAARHSARLICDEEGLSLLHNVDVDGTLYMLKDILCACIEQESGFRNLKLDGTPTRHVNYESDGVTVSSTDWGICQINDYFHIGPGKDFPSVAYVVANPDAAVRFMARMFNAGKASLWSSYASGAYKQWL